MTPSPIASRRLPLAALLVLPSLLTLILLWLPFGFGMGGLIEEWGLLGNFNTFGPMPLAWLNGPLATHAVRPLMPFTFYLGYLISPDSPLGWHLLLLGALLLKGGAAAYMAYRTTASPRWAALFGPLALLYPADTMVLSFRSLHIDWAMALVLAGGALVMSAEGCGRASVMRRGAAAAVLVFLAACMYEAALTLILLPLLLVFARAGFGGTLSWLRRQGAALLLFWGGAVCYAGYAIWIAGKIASYQSSVAGGGRGVLTVLRESLPLLFSVGYTRALLGGWRDAFGIVGKEFSSHGYLALATLLILLASWLLARRAAPAGGAGVVTPERTGHALRLALAGLAVCAMGYAPFLLLPSHQVISQRTFLWAAVGAAFFVLALLMLAARLHRLLAWTAALLLLCAGMGAQMYQFHHYQTLSTMQNALLRAIVANYDGKSNGKTLVIADETNLIGHTWTFPDGLLQSALAYAYGHDVGAVQVCHMPAGEWIHMDSLARHGSCAMEEGAWVFRSASSTAGPGGYVYTDVPTESHIPAGQAITLTIHPDFSASASGGSAPPPVATADTVTGRRWRNAFAAPDGWQLFRDQSSAPASYRWDFGRWWSLEVPTRGTGWREAEWNRQGIRHISVAWKTGAQATLDFPLAPRNGPYLLRAKFAAFTNPAAQSDLKLSINGSKVAFKMSPDLLAEAVVPPGVLRNGLNQLTVVSPQDHAYFDLSLQMDWFDIAPLAKQP